METRPVRREEAAGLRELRLRALRDAPHAYFASLESEESLPLSDWEGWATSKDKIMLVAVEDGAWLGMAGASVHPDRSGTVRLWWLWVAPGARGRGLARRLLDARAKRENNEAARALYRGFGFVPTRAGIFMARLL